MNGKKIVVHKKKGEENEVPSHVARASRKYYGGRKIRLVRKPEDEVDELDDLQTEQQRLAEQMAQLRAEEQPANVALAEHDLVEAIEQPFDEVTAYEEADPEYKVASPRHRPSTIRIDIDIEGPRPRPAGGGMDMPPGMDLRKILSDSCRIPDLAVEKKLHESQQIVLGEPATDQPAYERDPLFLRHDELGICYVYTYAADAGEQSLNTAFETIYRIGLEPPKCFLLPNHIETKNPHLVCVNPFLGAEELHIELGYFLMDHKIWRYSEYVMPAGPSLRYFWRHLDNNGRLNLQTLFDKILRSSGNAADNYALSGVRPVEFIGVTNPFRCQYF